MNVRHSDPHFTGESWASGRNLAYRPKFYGRELGLRKESCVQAQILRARVGPPEGILRTGPNFTGESWASGRNLAYRPKYDELEETAHRNLWFKRGYRERGPDTVGQQRRLTLLGILRLAEPCGVVCLLRHPVRRAVRIRKFIHKRKNLL